jgi:integrase
MPLTTAKVAELLRSGASVKVPDGRSMYLVVRGVGKGYYVGQYRDHTNGGKFQTRGLGRAPDTSLAAARRAWEDDRAARRGRVNMGNGSSDSATAPKVIPVPTGKPFGAASTEYIAVKANEWRGGATGKTARLYEADARTSLPDGRPLARITWPELTDEVIGLYVAGMSDRKAKDTKERLEAVREYMRGGKVKTKKIVEHHVALPWADVPAFFKKLDDSPAARALAFTVLTAVRIGDVVGTKDKPPATWGEIDSDGLWTIPGDDANGKGRTKSGATHTVPLSRAALSLLGPRGANDAPLFPALSYFQVYRFKEKLGTDIDIHGFRSSFRDWCGDHGIDRELAEMNMAHSVGDATEQAYRRSDYIARRKPIMESWTEHCTA